MTMHSGRAENIGIRIILFMGIGTFLFLMLMSFGLKRSIRPQEITRVKPGDSHSPFDPDRAWADLKHLVALGPRPSGSEAMVAQRKFILGELRRAGLKTRQQAFDAKTPRGTIAMSNIWGVVRGTRPGVIMLSNHYDTKYFPGFPFVGANDGASTTAWMLEMARAFGAQREGRSLWLVFFDGEEAQKNWSAEDSLYGSRHMVSQFQDSGELMSIEALINVDMIGDCYLSISKDDGAPKWLTESLWKTA
ncbi:MAG: M28 family peptidase, partial [Candidatus Hydrogenedentes bacterium]|nr:M28 family peptidase [Candidatus Hydrogenedentota bacterium]